MCVKTLAPFDFYVTSHTPATPRHQIRSLDWHILATVPRVLLLSVWCVLCVLRAVSVCSTKRMEGVSLPAMLKWCKEKWSQKKKWREIWASGTFFHSAVVCWPDLKIQTIYLILFFYINSYFSYYAPECPAFWVFKLINVP